MTAALAPVRLAESLRLARLCNASDLHLHPGNSPVMRVDGSLQPQDGPPADAQEIDAIAGALIDAPAMRRLERYGDVTAGFRDAAGGVLRVHAYRTSRGTALAIRLLPQAVPSLESLDLPNVTGALADRAAGLVLVAGPTGSGKSTTLAAIVDRINATRAKHVVTIEDPIEYVHVSKRSLITQRQIESDVPDFSQAVHGALRCDPDVVLIGEMRDCATMHAALTAAETGHLVFSTLHTGDAPATIDRIVGAFSDGAQDQIRVQLAQTLAGVICTRLVRRAFGEGRRAAVEILLGTDAVKNLIRDGKTHQLRNVICSSGALGMQTLEKHLCALVALGEISLDEARGATDRPAEVRPADIAS